MLDLADCRHDADRSEVLQKIHEAEQDFLPRLIAYFDGEKDPRNLMIVFSILRVVMVEWDVSAEASVCRPSHPKHVNCCREAH